MDKRYLTILVIPGDSSRPKQLKVSVRLLKTFLTLSVLVLLTVGFIVYDYSNMRLQVLELKDLKKENTAQKLQIRDFSAKIGELEAKIAKLNLFDKKLRIIANLEKPDDTDRAMGMGGPSTDEDMPSLDNKMLSLEEQMHSALDQLSREADMQELSFTELEAHLLKQSSMLASTPSIWPTRGWLSSRFGKRISPFTGLPQRHRGIDIANRVGTPVVATADGIVVKVGRDRFLGRKVIIDHGYGIKTIYGHLSKVVVHVGQKVKRGQKIANMGNTGRSTGPHLHYEVAVNGVKVNPLNYILD